MDSAYDSDDGYGPVPSTWGDQAITDNHAAAIGHASKSWHSLVDPAARRDAGEYGSGNLHRRGKNYMPVDEDAILQHRLKGGSLQPKKDIPGHSARKDTKKPPPGKRMTPPKKSPCHQTPAPEMKPPSPTKSAPRHVRTPLNGNSPWHTSSLSNQPFWEQPRAPACTPSGGTVPTAKAKPLSPTGHDSAPSRPGNEEHLAHAAPSWKSGELATSWESFMSSRRGNVTPLPETSAEPMHQPVPQTAPAKPKRLPPGLSQHAFPDATHSTSPFPSLPPYLSTTRTAFDRPKYSKPPGLSPIPLNIAKHDPNPVVVTIKIEVETGHHAHVRVRLYDDPELLARQFVLEHGITDFSVIQVLTDMFVQQKHIAMKNRVVN